MPIRRFPLGRKLIPHLNRRNFLRGGAALTLGTLLPGLGGCGGYDWTDISATGFDYLHFDAEALFFSSTRTGFFGGMYNDWDTLREPGLFVTQDGGFTWRRLALPAYRLGVKYIYARAEEIFVYLEGIVSSGDAGVFLHSRDNGVSWKELFGQDADIHVKSSAQVSISPAGDIRLVNTRKDDTEVLLSHKAAGDAWEETPLPSARSGWTQLGPHTSLFCAWNGVGEVVETTYVEEGITVSLPRSLRRPHLIPGPERSWLVCGLDETSNKLQMFRLTPEGCLPTGSPFADKAAFIKDLSACGKTICCTVFNHASFFSRYPLYVSRDAGATWVETQPSRTLRMEPSFQYQEEFFIARNGMETFARFNFADL